MNRILLAISLLLFLSFACNQNKQVAKPLPEGAKAYLYGYTQGIISRIDPLRIQFAAMAATEQQVGQELTSGIAKMSPAADGKWVWLDRQTLQFTPDEPLAFATTYIVTVQLAKLFDNVPDDARSFEFSVTTRDPFVSLTVEGLETPQVDVRDKQLLKGILNTSDYVSHEQAAALVKSVTQGGRTLNLTWTHSDDGTEHRFVANGVARGKEASEVVIDWHGEPISAQQADKKKVEVPAIGDFKVTNVIAQGVEDRIDVYFSDPLDENQDFNGLVNISDSDNDFRYQVEAHILRVFLNNPIQGEQRLTVFPGVKNRFKAALPKTSIWDISLSSREPEVRLLGNGNILPSSSGLVFPFEAIGLHTVEVEIFKIYHNNILQFLQVNPLEGQNDLYRVGKVIKRMAVPLNQVNPVADQKKWTRYGLDLRQLFDADPKAIYQVRIGFRREHAAFACSDKRNFDFSANEEYYNYDEDNTYDNGLMSAWYGLEGYYREFSWEHRDDPCYPAYYNSDRFIARNVLASNLGVIVKGGAANTYSVVVSDMMTTQPLAGVSVSFFDYQQQVLEKVTTDAQGMAKAKLSSKAFFALAQTSNDQIYLRLENNEALSMSRFDVSGQTLQDGLKGFLYGERGVWRPGDSVFLNFVLEDKDALLPSGYPIAFEIRNAQGQIVEKRNGVLPKGLIYPLHFKTNASDATGVWQAKVVAGSATFLKNIRIETIKPNRIKIDVDLAENPLRLSSGKDRGTLTAAWLHGAPAAGLKANMEATFTVRRDGFEAFKQYTVLDAEFNPVPESKVVFDQPLTAEGKGAFSINLPKGSLVSGPLQMTLKTRVFERGGDFSTDVQSFPVHPFDQYAALLLPRNKYNSPRLNIGEQANVGLAAVNYQGKGSANRKLKAELYKVEWRWWWDDEDNRGARYTNVRNLNPVSSVEKTTGSDGRANWNISVGEWGRYLIRVCDTQSGHCASGFVYAGNPWYGENTFSEEASMLTFRSDKEKYNVGDNIQITFPAGGNGRALLSLENGRGVLEERWIETKAGDNTYSFKATAAMTPTVYAHLSVIQPHGQDDNDLPMRAYGVVPIGVEDPDTRLKPVVKVADELKPEQNFTVEVRESSGHPMTYTLAVVDEGLLGVTRFKTPNPHDAFYAREALGVRTWDLYNFVLGKNTIPMNQLLSIGGDGEGDGKREADRANRFEPVVLHLGPFQLGKNGKTTHNLRMPNYIGAVRVMVVAADKGAYGAVDKTVPVRKPLMLLATLPRVLGIGEQLELPVNLFAMKDGIGNVTVRVEESSGLVRLVNATQQRTFNKMGDDLVSFPVEVGNRTGVAKFRIIAEGGGERTTQEIEIDVRNPNPTQTLTERFVLEAGETKTLPYTPFGSEGTRSGVLEVSNFPPIDVERAYKYLLDYPYGCLEQTMSSGFAQLHLSTFVELDANQQKKTTEHVAAALTRLRSFQQSNGCFSYWPGNDYYSNWATSYAGHFLLAAKAKGYTLPAGMLDSWIGYQKETARVWDGRMIEAGFVEKHSFELDQAYRLYTLALAGKAEMGAMNRLREVKNLGKAARWRLAAAYAQAGQKSTAEQLVNNLDTQINPYRELGYTFGSEVRDKAMMLETLLLLGKGEAADRMAQLLSKEMSSNRWLSTQEVAYSLLAFSQYVGKNDKISKTYTFTFQQNGRKAIDAGATRPYMQVKLANEAGNVVIKNTSQQKLFGSIIRRGQPLPSEEQATSSLVRVNVTYLDAAGKPLNVQNLPQGTDFVAEVSVQHTGEVGYEYKEMALRQIFPSGWEITNTRLEGIERAQESGFIYRDFRDDRVHTFFNLGMGETATYRVYLTAAYVGRYYLPATTSGAMYDDQIQAATPGYWVTVGDAGDEG